MPVNLDAMNTTTRFSDRVSDYDLYRPSYPDSLMSYLDQQVGLSGSRVADIGAGTGIFSRLLLDRGAIVDAIEPNSEMGRAAIENLGERSEFHFRSGTAENSGLAGASVDLITCAQAFHWFEPKRTRLEFDRILKPGGKVALVWNDQKKDRGLGQAYEEIKAKFGAEAYRKVVEVTQVVDDFLPEFFGSRKYEARVFDNFQDLDGRGFVGRFFSSSYAPMPDTEAGKAARLALLGVFKDFAQDRKVRLEYKTELFLGR